VTVTPRPFRNFHRRPRTRYGGLSSSCAFAPPRPGFCSSPRLARAAASGLLPPGPVRGWSAPGPVMSVYRELSRCERPYVDSPITLRPPLETLPPSGECPPRGSSLCWSCRWLPWTTRPATRIQAARVRPGWGQGAPPGRRTCRVDSIQAEGRAASGLGSRERRWVGSGSQHTGCCRPRHPVDRASTLGLPRIDARLRSKPWIRRRKSRSVGSPR
jgi:hypothetical protein